MNIKHSLFIFWMLEKCLLFNLACGCVILAKPLIIRWNDGVHGWVIMPAIKFSVPGVGNCSLLFNNYILLLLVYRYCLLLLPLATVNRFIVIHCVATVWDYCHCLLPAAVAYCNFILLSVFLVPIPIALGIAIAYCYRAHDHCYCLLLSLLLPIAFA